MIHKTALIGKSAKIGKDTNIWAFCNILDGAKIGKSCNICDFCFIEGKAEIGNNVTLKNGVYIWDGVKIEDNVFIGPNATFTNDKYPRSKNKNFVRKNILIKKGASVGANATILPGITVGEYALVGAGAVVTKDVPSYALVYGNPAKVMGKVDEKGNIIK